MNHTLQYNTITVDIMAITITIITTAAAIHLVAIPGVKDLFMQFKKVVFCFHVRQVDGLARFELTIEYVMINKPILSKFK